MPPYLRYQIIKQKNREKNRSKLKNSFYNRTYYHSGTNILILPTEMHDDSEEDADPESQMMERDRMMKDFIDVNPGEKAIFMLWNRHMMQYSFAGFCHIHILLERFVEDYGNEILKKNLYNNFVLHLCNLFDHGLISSQNFYEIIKKIQKLIIA